MRAEPRRQKMARQPLPNNLPHALPLQLNREPSKAYETGPYRYKYRRDVRFGPTRMAEQLTGSCDNRQSSRPLTVRPHRLPSALTSNGVANTTGPDNFDDRLN